jgi:ABC-type phosphate transport system substrate-binding protein
MCSYRHLQTRCGASRLSAVAANLLALVAAALFAQPAHSQMLVVIVNPSIGVQQLSRREALDIFLGRYRTFPSGASALPIDLDVASAERRQFYLVLAHKDLSEMSSYWARLTFSGKVSPPFSVADARMAVEMVANNPNAIAYVDRSAVDRRVRIALEVGP